MRDAPVAQLDRALASGAKGHRFESCRVHLKTLAEIAIEAGLVTKASAVRAGRMAEEKKQPLVTVLIRDLGIDEVALLGALRKQTRVPLIDPAQVQVDPEALRLVAKDTCVRLRVLPLAVATDGPTRVLRIAMADPTDTSAILELETLAHCEIEVTALPLSAIEELVDRGYRAVSTQVTNRPRPFADGKLVSKQPTRPPTNVAPDAEVSVTAQIPLISLQAPDLEARFAALCQVLAAKGIVTEAELAEALRKADSKGTSET